MNRTEAKKAAEEYADTRWGTKEQARRLSIEWDPSMYDAERQETVRAYMSCYDAMTKGEPDGYCAWHPDKGLIVETTDPRESETVLSLRKMMIHPQSLTLANIAVVEKLGYQVVPVKLIKVEGSSNG